MKFRHLLIICTLMLLAIYVAFFREFRVVTSMQAIYGTLIVILGVIPSIVSSMDQRECGVMPLMPLHGLFYATTLGLPALSSKTLWPTQNEDIINAALVLTILGLFCLYLGYYSCRRLFSKVNPISILPELSCERQIMIAWIMFVFYLPFQINPSLNSLPSLGQLSYPLGYLSLGILFALALDNALPKKHMILFAVAFAYSIISKTITGLFAQPVFFLVFMAIIYWNKKRIIPWHVTLLLFLIIVVLTPVKSVYRNLTWNARSSQNYIERVHMLYNSADIYYSNGIFSSIGNDTSTVNRLAHISTFAHVINMTPGSVPYWWGESYQTLWSSFIPRLLWPDKPEATIGQAFGHRYKLLNSDDKMTSFNLPWLPEFYANFGTIGVLMGMFAVGVLFQFLVQKFSAPSNKNIEHVLGITLLFNLFYAESNFSLMIGGVLLTFFAFYVLIRILSIGLNIRSPDYK